MRTSSAIKLLSIAVFALVGLVVAKEFGILKFQAMDTGGEGGTTIVTGGGLGYATTVKASALDKYTGSLAVVNMELWSSDNKQYVAETLSNAELTTLTTDAPNTFSGYLMVGNDNFESATDRGTDYYYTKYPVSWKNQGTVVFDRIPVCKESTVTWTGYDDGVAETTLNVSVGTDQTITSTELKIAAGGDSCLGNPQLEYPLAVCFNVSGTGAGSKLSDWDEVKVANSAGTIDAPGFIEGKSIIGGKCYVLPVPKALEDYASFRFGIVLDPATGVDPGTGAVIYAHLLDKTYYKNDDGLWVVGFGDESNVGSDSDIGIQTLGNEKAIYLS